MYIKLVQSDKKKWRRLFGLIGLVSGCFSAISAAREMLWYEIWRFHSVHFFKFGQNKLVSLNLFKGNYTEIFLGNSPNLFHLFFCLKFLSEIFLTFFDHRGKYVHIRWELRNIRKFWSFRNKSTHLWTHSDCCISVKITLDPEFGFY